MEDLKRCPFCDGNAKSIIECDSLSGSSFMVSAYIECSECGIHKRVRRNMRNTTFMDWYLMFEEVEKEWNQRA